MKKLIYALIIIFLLIILAGIFKFNVLTNMPGYNVDGNPTSSIATAEHLYFS